MHMPLTRARRRNRVLRVRRRELAAHNGDHVPRWEHDYALYPEYKLYLFDEYLEMGEFSDFAF
jgi:hypothetical protein